MKYLSLLISAAAAQTFDCNVSDECKTSEIIASLNQQYQDLGEITAATSVCMTVSGTYQGYQYNQKRCGPIEYCGTTVAGDDPYDITCVEKRPEKNAPGGGSSSSGESEEEGASKTIISAVTAAAAVLYAI